MKRVLQEALLVAFAGALLAFTANGLSARGLKLGKNWFPAGADNPTPPVATASNSTPVTLSNSNAAFEALAARFASEGLQLADGTQIKKLFEDPKRAQDLIVFIDARSEEHYAEGHIPGAFQYDRFHPENYLATLNPVCQQAEHIVFYCNGGECEESEFAAKEVRDGMGLPKEKIFVYAGGITEWRTNGMPVEIGARNSGVITNAGAAP